MRVLAVIGGALVLLAVFGALFACVARIEGAKVAALIWAVAIGGTGLIFGGIWLLFWGLS